MRESTSGSLSIVHSAAAYFPSMGGAQLHWLTIGRMLRARGHRVTALSQWKDERNRYLLDSTLLAPWGDDRYEIEGITVNRVQPTLAARCWMALVLPLCFPLPEIGYRPLSAWFARRFASRIPVADIVHNIRIGREHLSWASWLLARRRGAPFHITPNYSPRMDTRLGQVVMRHFFRLLRRADGVFVFTPAEAETMERLGVASHRVCRIGVGPLLANTWDAGAFRAKFGIRRHMVLFLAQKLAYKGFDALLAAAPRVWERHPDTSFVFIGPDYDDSAKRIGRLNDSRVLDLGRVEALDPLKTSALAAADLLAVPSRQEGIGGVYIEAWAMGKPVVSGRIPYLPVEDGVDGFQVEQEPGLIADRVVRLLSEPGLAAAMGERGRRKVEREFSWEAIVDRVETHYLGSRRGLGGAHRPETKGGLVS